MLSNLMRYHLGKLTVGIIVCQLVILRLVLLLEADDAIDSLATGGFLLLPLCGLALFVTYRAFQRRRWLLAAATLFFILPPIVIGCFSLYLLLMYSFPR